MVELHRLAGGLKVSESSSNVGARRTWRERLASPYVWVSTTYFAEGFPYNLVNTVAEAMFKEYGASLQAIGLTSAFHVPWNLKFLWAPFLDSYETKRRFMIAIEVVLSVLMIGLAMSIGLPQVLAVATVLFLVMGFVAATHDVAIDGYYLEALDEKGQSEFVGYRAAAWRVAAVASGGGILAAAGYVGWRVAWLFAFAAMASLTLYHFVCLPRVERMQRTWMQLVASILRPRILIVGVAVAAIVAIEGQRPFLRPAWTMIRDAVQRVPALASLTLPGWIGLGLLFAMLVLGAFVPTLRRRMERSDSAYAKAFVDFFEQPQVNRILALVVLFRVGESFLLKMRYPFLRDEVGMSTEFFGLAIVGVGSVATIVGTLVGGHLIARDGLRRWLWPFVLAQNLLNLLYMLVASLDDPAALGMYAVTGLIMVEHVGAGLGTAVFMVYIMRCCDPRHRATHMAILTALMSIGFSLAGMASGFLAAGLGYSAYFGFTFVATIPAMVLLRYVPHVDGREEADGGPAAPDPDEDALPAPGEDSRDDPA